MNTKALQILFLKEHGVLILQYLSENYSFTITMRVTENKDQSSQKNLSTLAKIGTIQFIIHFFGPLQSFNFKLVQLIFLLKLSYFS